MVPFSLRAMKEVADNVWLLAAFPPTWINIYLAGDVLFDSGTRQARKRVLKELNGRHLTAHALTHVHLDHAGSSAFVCREHDVPLYCGDADAHAMESGDYSKQLPENFLTRTEMKFWKGPNHPVERRLKEGDEVGGFRVIDTPGHSPGHVVYWRESDGVLIIGDVLTNMNLLTALPGLHEPLGVFTPDPAENRRSAKKLADLQPSVVLFGHGPPLRDPAKFKAFIDDLPA